jgi:hypothetical protein
MTEPSEVQITRRYGIWSCVSHKFVFGINEPSKNKAWDALERKIGKDSYKYRWECLEINKKARKLAEREKEAQDEKDY